MNAAKARNLGRLAWRAMTVALLGAAVLCLVLDRSAVVPAEARAGAAPQRLPPDATGMRVRVEAIGTERDGATGPHGARGWVLQPIGGVSTQFLGAHFDQRGCSADVSRDPLSTAPVQWRIETTALDVAGGRPKLQVHWTRVRTGNPVPEREDTRTITVDPGDVHVLDLADNPDPTSSCASMLIRISAEPVGPQFARPYVADLWAVDEAGTDVNHSVHVRVNGTGGDSIQYEFPPIDLESMLRGAPGARGLTMRLKGTIQAVLGGDGFVTVTLATQRLFVTSVGSGGGGGRTVFRARTGETAAVVLPDPPPHLGTDENSIDLARLFAGHHLSLYIRVEAAR